MFLLCNYRLECRSEAGKEDLKRHCTCFCASALEGLYTVPVRNQSSLPSAKSGGWARYPQQDSAEASTPSHDRRTTK